MSPKKNSPKPINSDQDITGNKLMALISYFWILFIIPLLAKKDSPYSQYHAKQGLALFLYSTASPIILWIAKIIVYYILPQIPIVNFIGFACRWTITIFDAFNWLFILIIFITGIINALTGKTKPLPLIGHLFINLKI